MSWIPGGIAIAVLDAAHVGEAHRERLEVLRLEVLHAANEQRALGADRLELGVIGESVSASCRR